VRGWLTSGRSMAAAAVLLAVVLVIAHPWRGRPERSTTQTHAAMRRGGDDASAGARAAADATQTPPPPKDAAESPIPAAADAAEASRAAVPAAQDFAALAEGVDPLLRERNLIVRSGDPQQNGPGFEDLESRFGRESADASWSSGMEARILGQISQLPGLGLVALDAECRATICRVKLVYPPGTNALSSSAKLRPIATQIGFAHVVEVATLGDDGAPISLLYFERDGA
jgi:hypothetical protein